MVLGTKKIEELARQQNAENMTKVLQEILDIWAKHKLTVPQAMDAVVNLQMHLNRQHIEIMRSRNVQK